WDIYAKMLFPLGYGYPLWHPAPENDSIYGTREVDLGSVGWIDGGRFRHIFNAMKPAEDEFNRNRVPDDFQRLEPSGLVITGEEDEITQSRLHSRTVTEVRGSAGLETSAIPAGCGFNFICTEDEGAFLHLKPPGVSKRISSKKHIVDYIRAHFESWFEFATQAHEGPGLILSPEEIIFVSGTIKTARWACSAFSGEYRHKEGTITCDISMLASADVSLSISNHVVPKEFSNFGPLAREISLSARLIDPHDQEDERPQARGVLTVPVQSPPSCVFIHYFKYRRRLFLSPTVIKAAAVPHELPPDSPE
ncbi:hypothetical protein OH76DRAFT_1324350, partial [Lentinus brumalis]